jgi:hypothetical protein
MLGVAGIAVLAIVETVAALLAPGRAPTDADWRAAAAAVRAEFRVGDLIVAAPAWADPLLRLHLGDLIPIPVAARMDDARYGRVWEIGQRGAHVVGPGVDTTAAGTPPRIAVEARFGALTVRRIERPAAEVTFDFLERWTEATVTEVTSGRSGGAAPCPWLGDRFACPGGGPTVHRELVEVDTRIRRALLAPPPHAPGGRLIVAFPAVPLGRELVVAAGLHDVWARKLATGQARLEVFVGDVRVGDVEIGNRSGWRLLTFDTSRLAVTDPVVFPALAPALAGNASRPPATLPVRFEISSTRPELRHLAFAAEARR